ncbi:MAG: hypothetical protein U0176_05595 [Bacteroidia bacterium]
MGFSAYIGLTIDQDMDIFNGNKKLEEVIFDALDYALYSRHDIRDVFVPFMVLHSGGERRLVRLVGGGDPNAGFEQMLRGMTESYDFIATCCEGRMTHGDTKQDAIFVKGFDTSLPEGFLFGQRFQGIESGGPFRKLGNPALLSKTEPLPVPLVARDEDEEYDEPYVSGMVVKAPHGSTKRVIVASHTSASVLSPALFDFVVQAISKAEPDFSGEFLFNFVPDSLKNDGLNRFILDMLHQDLLEFLAVKAWESKTGHRLQISLEFNDGKGEIKLARTGGNKSGGASGGSSGSTAQGKKPWWKFW